MSQCSFCQSSITYDYFRVQDRIACPACVEKAGQVERLERGFYLRKGLLRGAVAALITGALLWGVYEVGALSGSSIFSLGAYLRGAGVLFSGAIIGGAVIGGAKGRGSRALQVGAGILTYLAISLAFVPFMVVRMPAGKASPLAILFLAILAPALPFVAVVKAPIALSGLACDGLAVWSAVKACRYVNRVDGPFLLRAPGENVVAHEPREIFSSPEIS